MRRVSSAIGAAFLGIVSIASVALAAPGTTGSAAPPVAASVTATATATASAKPATSAKPAGSAKPASSAKSDPKKKDDKKDDAKTKSPKSLTTPNLAVSKKIAGGPSSIEPTGLAESTELKTLREAEIDLFAGAAPPPGQVWPSDLPAPPKGPLSNSGGLPPEPVTAPEVDSATFGSSLSWLSGLKMPDLPVRWDTRVVKYLEFFKDDPRGRRIMTVWYKRSGRYRALITSMLRARSMPEDLAWLAMAESGFDPVIKSPAGAAGLWQFMPEAGKIYGLSIDRWADGRNSPARATEAALNYLADLKKRFGSWELAMAAYNMGYGGALATVKKFNSNDYWELSKLENGLPWETSLYVPKIIALAIVARNPEVFGYDTLIKESSLEGESVEVPAGSELKAIANAAGCTLDEMKALNPELKAGRTPPAVASNGKSTQLDDAPYTVFVPPGKALAVKEATVKLAPKGNGVEKYVVRFGETIDQIAAARKTTKAKLVELNGIGKDEVVRGGTVLLVPPFTGTGTGTTTGTGTGISTAIAVGEPIKVLVPSTTFAYPDRQRVFYRVVIGDTPRDIAEAFSVSVDDLRTWNSIEPTARLQEGMTLQVFAPKNADLSRVVAMKEGEVKIVAIGSDDFYAIEEAAKGRKRTTIYAAGGETLEKIGKKYDLTPGQMEKINRRPRTDVLAKGEAVIVYVKGASTEAGTTPPPNPALANDLPAKPASESTGEPVDPPDTKTTD